MASRFRQRALVGVVTLALTLGSVSLLAVSAASAKPMQAGKTYLLAFEVPPPHPSEDPTNYDGGRYYAYGSPSGSSGPGISAKTLLFIGLGAGGLFGLYRLRARRRANW